jgi:hypothetical protein
VSEEFAPNNIKLPLPLKQELINNFNTQVPSILSTLKSILESANSTAEGHRPPAPKLIFLSLGKQRFKDKLIFLLIYNN